MDCEVEHILQGIQEHMVILSEDPTIKIPMWDTELKFVFLIIMKCDLF